MFLGRHGGPGLGPSQIGYRDVLDALSVILGQVWVDAL